MYHFDAVALSVEVTNANEAAFTRDWQSGVRPVWAESSEAQGQDNHCVCAIGRPDLSHITIISWDRPVNLTNTFRTHQSHEAWCYASPDRINKVTGKSYSGATPTMLEEYVRSQAAHQAAGHGTIKL